MDGGEGGQGEEGGQLHVPQGLLLQIQMCCQVTEYTGLKCIQLGIQMCQRCLADCNFHLYVIMIMMHLNLIKIISVDKFMTKSIDKEDQCHFKD